MKKSSTKSTLPRIGQIGLTLLTFLFLLTSRSSIAQVSLYSFSQSTGTYTAITGGTSLVSCNGCGTSYDSQTFPVTLPSAFPFNGSSITNVTVCVDGSLVLGTTTGTSATGPLANTQTATGVISALGMDLRNSTISGITYELRWEDIGSEYVFQWTNAARWLQGGSERFSFQIRINKTSGVISYVYDTPVTIANSTSYQPVVGLRGTANTDYVARRLTTTIPTATPTWTNTAEATSNSQTLRFTSGSPAAVPIGGLTYTWTPPVACVAPSAQPTALVLTPASTSISGSFTAASPAVDRYLVVRTTGAAPTNPVNGTTYTTGTSLGGNIVYVGPLTTFSNTGLTENSSYTYYVFSYNSQCTGGPLYNTVSPLTATAITCPAVPGSVTTSALSTSSFTLGWSSSLGGGNSAVTYTVDVATDNAFANPVAGSPFSVSDPTVSLPVTGLNPATTYYYRVRANGSCNSAYSTTGNVTTLCTAITSLPWTENFDALATVGGTSFPVCWFKENGDWRSANTASTTYDNNARSPQNFIQNAYSATNEFIWTPTFQLNAGQSYDFSFWFVGYTGLTGWTGDVFVNTTKSSVGAIQVGSSFITATQADPTSYTKVLRSFIPATSGAYTFAIRINATSSPWYLSFDDFALELTPTCFPPTAPLISNITINSADIAWTAPTQGSPANYVWKVVANGAGANATAVASGTVAHPTLSATATGLSSSTAYQVYIRTDCGAGDTSSWVSSAAFTTLCDPTNIPYIMPIAGVTAPALPTCVSRIDVNADATTWRSYGTGSITGWTYPILGYPYNSTNNANDWLFTQGLNLTAGVSYTVKYKFNNDGLGLYPEKLKVMYGTSATPAGMVNLLADYPHVANNTPQFAEIPFTPSTTGVYYVGFQAYSNADMDILILDDISVELTPTCPSPLNPSISGVSSTQATLSWEAPLSGTPANYIWQVIPASAGATGTPIASGVVASPSTSTTFSGFAADTNYVVYVRSECGGGDSSAWTTSNFTPTFTYCSPAPSSVDGTGITRVVMGTIDNTTAAETNNYGDYSALVTNVPVGEVFPINITYSTGYMYGTIIWVDLNNNNVFENSEIMYYGLSGASNPNTLAASITIPSNTSLGLHRIRIGGTDNDDGPSGPCYTSSYGTFEDYTLNIVVRPSDPVSLTQSSATPSCAGGSALYVSPTAPTDITYYLQTSASDTSTAIPFVGDSVIVNTNGTYYVRAKNTVNSLWSNGSATVTINNVPVAPLPPSPVADQSPACLSTNISVPAPTDPNVTYYWQGTTMGGTDNTNNASSPLAITSSGTYYVAAYDASTNCWSNTNGVAVVIDQPIPTAPVVVPSSATICDGDQVLLQTSSPLESLPSGAGTSSSSASTTGAGLGPNPFQSYYGGTKQQQLFTVADLTAMGVAANTPITSIALQMNNASTSYTLQNVIVKMKHTTLTALSTWETGMTTVRTASSYTPNAGWSYIPFTSAFTWNGTDAIVLEVNYTNNNGGATTPINTAFYTSTATVTTLFYRTDNATSATINSYSGATSYTYSTRNNFKFLQPQGPTSWSPSTGLFTDSNLSNPYVLGAMEDTVYASPSVTTTYTAVSNNGACVSAGTDVTVTVNPLPTVDAGPTQVNVCPITTDVTLSGSGAVTYAWDNGVIDNTPFTAPTVNTLYTVTGTDANGCSNTDTVSIFVAPTTPVSISPAGPIVTCQNQPVVITANGPAPGPVATITQWDFNNSDLVPTVGSGSASLIGGTTQAFNSGAGSTDPTQPGIAWSTTTYPAQGTASETAGVQYNVSTAGYTNINFSFDIRHSGTAANTYVVQYNPDVTNPLAPWLDVETLVFTTYNSFSSQSIDLSSIPAANDNANLGLRVVSAFDTLNGSNYVNINTPTQNYGTAGTVRYDMVTFAGQPLTATYSWTGGSTSQSITPPTSGTYVVTVTESGVCPGVDSVSITINPVVTTTLFPVICDDDTYMLVTGMQVNTTGVYTNTVPSVATGCDSIVVVNLTVNPTYNNTIPDVTICSNESYTLANGDVVSAADTYTRTVQTVNGCDSTVTVTVIVLPAQNIPVSASICANEDYTLPDATVVTAAGTYTNTFAAANGCDSTIVTTLTVLPVFTSSVSPVICDGDTYSMPDGSTETVAGVYTFPYNAVNGCDSTITVDLTVNPVYTTNVSIDLCPGENYTLVDNTVINSGGVYTAVTNTINGCDSTVIVTATDRLAYNTPVSASICQGGTYTLVNGTTVTDAGSYVSATQSIYGCDSVVTVNLTVNPVYNIPVAKAICEGESYQLPDGTSVSDAGSYTSQLTSSAGCDSVIVTTLTVNPLPNVNLGSNIAVPNPPVILNAGTGFSAYDWSTGATTQTISVTQNGTYSVTVTNQFGCEATDEVQVNFTASIADLGSNGGSISLFPNPTADRFVVNVYGYTGGGDLRFDIINAIGQVVRTEKANNSAESFTKEMDVTTLASGTYTLRVKGNNAEANLRLIIAR